jgi:hypothetical protein
MNIQARRISGSSFSAEDILEAVLDTEGQDLAYATHTIKMVSGPTVTHGGGAPVGEYLHYKALLRDDGTSDADANGIINYSQVQMGVTQQEKGLSVIKVVCSLIKKEDVDAFNTVREAFMQRRADAGVDEENVHGINDDFYEELPEVPYAPSILESGEVTLEWSDDNFV